MLTFKKATWVIGLAVSLGTALPVFAEAPVYDADSLPQQFENVDQQNQELPPPPSPEQQEGGFAPAQPSASSSTSSMSVGQRIRRMEQQIDNMQNSGTTSRVDSLQSQIQSLQGQVEQLTHQLEQMQEQQKTMYSDLDRRVAQGGAASTATTNTMAANSASTTGTAGSLDTGATTPDVKTPALIKPAHKTKKIEAAASSAATTAVNTSGDQPNVAEEQQIYQTAYNQIKAKKYADAVDTLQSMLKKYPSGQFASNAHYWLGELYGLMGKNDQALSEFSTVVKTYPDSPRISDAQLKVGLIYASQSKWTEAKSAFKKVINTYPGTASSRLASEQLKQLKQAGH